MTTRVIKTERDRDDFVRLAGNYKYPYTVTIKRGGIRSIEQNRLQRLWHNEAAEQLQDESAEDKRAYCKLTFGVRILCAEDEDFQKQYDRVVRPLPYETQLELMKVPFDFPVTRLMTTVQKTQFLDEIRIYYTALGVRLTDPDRGAW